MAETNTMDVIFVDYLLPNEPEGTTPHHVTLKEFLALPPEKLTEQNQKIQKALGQLYKLNDREPPLFHSFPKREAGPLVINCGYAAYQNLYAYYEPNENKVALADNALAATELYLLSTFAHELKHAEQTSEEHYSLQRKMQRKDGLAYHQLRYLNEAQAYAFGSYVLYLSQLNTYPKGLVWLHDLPTFPILERHSKEQHIDDFRDIEYEMMKEVLPLLYQTEGCRADYDDIKPISEEDIGLMEAEIPASFHFKHPREALLLLQDMPREAMTSADKLRFAIVRGAFQALQKHTMEFLIRDESVSPDEFLDIIETEFTSSPENVSEVHIKRSESMLNFLLDLKVDGKLLMQEKDITKLLAGARASGRKDVEEAILEYQKEHPDDERFPEKMFNPNPKDKVAEYKKRKAKEAEATKIKAVAGKKPVPALAAAKTAKGR